jgi:hypothetical protein
MSTGRGGFYLLEGGGLAFIEEHAYHPTLERIIYQKGE